MIKTVFQLHEITNLERFDTNTETVTKKEIINTNLANNRPDWLPKNTVSKCGTLSTKKLLAFLEINPIQKEERLLWHFMQRKYPSPTNWDTFYGEDQVEDSEGYAVTNSLHAPHSMIFLEDCFVSQIYPCTSIRFIQDYPLGIYEDGRVMIQQIAVRGCVAAVAAMLIEEHHKNCDFKSLRQTNISNDLKLISWLEKAELQAKQHTITGGLVQLIQFVQSYGSLACTIEDKEIKAHSIILDEINEQFAIIRDPAHGWRIQIPCNKFMEIAGQKLEIVYLTK
jgi:hypothetical protein